MTLVEEIEYAHGEMVARLAVIAAHGTPDCPPLLVVIDDPAVLFGSDRSTLAKARAILQNGAQVAVRLVVPARHAHLVQGDEQDRRVTAGDDLVAGEEMGAAP